VQLCFMHLRVFYALNLLTYLAIQCNGTALPNFINAQRLKSYTEVMPFAHNVIYSCVHEGHRFEDGDTTLSVTCSLIGWTWNPIVTSCQRRLIFTARCYAERGIATASRPSISPSVRDFEVYRSHKLE